MPTLPNVQPLTDAQRELADANRRLVGSFAKRYATGDEHRRDELFQVGCFGLMRATQKFDPTKDIKFSTYAAHWIKQSIRRWLDGDHLVVVSGCRDLTTDGNRRKQLAALAGPSSIEGDLIGEEIRERPYSDKELAALRKAIGFLEPTRRLIVLRKLKGDTNRDIGRDIGHTREWVGHLHAAALDDLRRMLSFLEPGREAS